MIFSTLFRLLVVNLKALLKMYIRRDLTKNQSPRGPSSTSGPPAPTIFLGTFDHSASSRLFSESPKGIVPPPIERRGEISCSVYLCTCLLVLLVLLLLLLVYLDQFGEYSQSGTVE